MAQHSNEHLTITELSAYLDKELAPKELALCDAHIQTCQLCQAALADLRLTSALLNSMPQVAVPRSFTLPTNLLTLPETPAAPAESLPKARPTTMRAPSPWRRTLTTASTLVAILGLFFILAGAFASLPRMANTTAGTLISAPQQQAPAATARASQQYRATSTAAAIAATPTAKSTDTGAGQATPTPAYPQVTPGGTSTPGVQNTPTSEPPAPQLPEALDLSQPGGRLVIGGSLLLLGLLGVLATRLFTRSSAH